MHIGTLWGCLTQEWAACVIIRCVNGEKWREEEEEEEEEDRWKGEDMGVGRKVLWWKDVRRIRRTEW